MNFHYDNSRNSHSVNSFLLEITLILTDAALKKIIWMLHICGQPFSFILIEHKKCHCLLKQIAVLVLEM